MDSKTVQREKRYTAFGIQKHPNGESTATATIAIGYYDEFDGKRLWITEKEESIFLNNDQLTIMMGLKHGDLGLTANTLNLFKFLDTAIYGIIGGQLRIDYTLNLNVKDKDTKADITEYAIHVKRGDTILQSQYMYAGNTVALKGSAAVGATVEISKGGYVTFTKDYPVLRNDVTETIELEPVSTPMPPMPTPTEPTEPTDEEPAA